MELLSSFDLLSQTMRNSVFKKATLSIKEDLSRGLDLSLSMGKTNLFPERVIQLVVAGERTNRLEEMPKKISSLYERELEPTHGEFPAPHERQRLGNCWCGTRH